MTADSLNGNFESQRAWSNVFQVLKDYKYPPGQLYPEKLSTVIEGERKALRNLNRLKGFTCSRPTLKRRLAAILQTEQRNKHNQETRKKTNEAIISKTQSMTKNTNRKKK